MLKYLYLTLAYILLGDQLPGQSLSGPIWCFGDSAEISFKSGSPVSVSGCVLSTLEGTSTVYDNVSNQLLFYTDGTNIWNRNNVIMPGNTIPLGGNSSSTQSSLVVPVPGQSRQFYLFALDDQAGFYNDGDSGLSYSIIDMSLNGGLGNVLQQPQPLLTPTTEKLTATPMANGQGFWVLAHLWNSDAFYAYPVTQAGLGNPVISHQGCVHTGDTAQGYNEAIGYMHISPDGSKLAVGIMPTISKVELFTFDNSSGKVTGMIFSDSNYPWDGLGWGPYGISFSPNSKVLYVTYQRSDSFQNYLIQYDLSLPTGQAMMATRDSFKTSGPYTGAAVIAPDGKIYIANTSRHGGQNLDRVNNPDVVGPGCNFEQNAFILTYGRMILGLPNPIVVSPTINDSIATTSQNLCKDSCSTNAIAKPLSGYPPYSYQWSSPAQNDSLAANLCPGKYYVTITDQFGTSATDSVVITSPSFSSGKSEITENGNLLQCTNATKVQWYLNGTAVPGADNPVYLAPQAGSYIASGIDKDGCNFSDTIAIEASNYFFPNAFTPNNDGVNDIYYPALQPGATLLSFKIFDRWGELLYDDISRGWDGKYKGVEQPPAVYVYFAEVQSADLNNNGQLGLQKVKGSFVLIR